MIFSTGFGGDKEESTFLLSLQWVPNMSPEKCPIALHFNPIYFS
jgi:hypothetical protein